jgi:NAD(P)-dependent dehydrogenase (short-subunit alcohol dehydrogenase family)
VAAVLDGRTILVTGATGGLGDAAVAAAAKAGARVVAVGRDDATLGTLRARHPTCVRQTVVADLLDAPAVVDLATEVGPGVDAVWHLVGGWRGGTVFPDQPLEDWELLNDSLARTTLHVARAFADPLSGRPAGRFAMVSSPFAASPTSRNAAYAAAKAAAETIVLALADHLRPTTATANIVVVPSILTDAMRDADPSKDFGTAVPAEQVASTLVYVTSDAAAKMNGQRIKLHARGRR